MIPGPKSIRFQNHFGRTRIDTIVLKMFVVIILTFPTDKYVR